MTRRPTSLKSSPRVSGVTGCWALLIPAMSKLTIEAGTQEKGRMRPQSNYGRGARQIGWWERSKHANGARNQNDDDRQRDTDLGHGQKLCPARQQRGVSGTKGRTLRKRDEEIIDEAGPPPVNVKTAALDCFDLHLRENETAAAEFAPLLATGRPAAVQPPVPNREDEDVC